MGMCEVLWIIRTLPVVLSTTVPGLTSRCLSQRRVMEGLGSWEMGCLEMLKEVV
ncbi:hypothetical protein BT69DRAFT_1278862, partial [Atractiella rhizophila]